MRKHRVVPQNFFPKPAALIFGAFTVLSFGTAFADPPDRVARLSYESGTVTFEPAGTQDYVQATPNRPLITGDALWVDTSSRAELNVGRAALRADTQTSISITNLDDRVAQFQLAQGTAELTVRSMAPDAVYEIDTPNLALTINQPGQYRVTVTPDGQTTYALVRQGSATATGENQSYAIGANQSYSFTGTDLSNYTYYDPPAADDFDRFSAARDTRWEHSSSLRYVSPEMIGYEDLDANGTWQNAEGYGNVWVPNNVGPDWAPYQAGHWAFVSPWGWTWVDDAAWGFAPFHYGRWAHIGFGWAWIPGPIEVAPVYAPALVGFVGGSGGFSLAVGGGGGIGVAWFPLGPREVYRPAYEVSPAYVQRVNVTNTVVTTTVVNNVYNSTTVVHYANQGVPNAVTAVPQNAFASGQSVSRVAIHVTPSLVANQPVGSFAAVAPTQRAVSGPGSVSNFHPSAAAMTRPVVARTAPPPPPVAFAAKAQALAANPGRPISPAVEQQLQRSTAPAVQRPQPHVVTAPTQAAVAPPPRAATSATAPRPGAVTPAAAQPAFNRPAGVPPAGVARPPETANPGRPMSAPTPAAIPQQREAIPAPALQQREAIPAPARPAVAPQGLQPNPAQRPEPQRAPAERSNEKNEKNEKNDR